jgi:RHS repeat-associated protein
MPASAGMTNIALMMSSGAAKFNLRHSYPSQQWLIEPSIMQFNQPDSIIPSPANPQSWNRCSYVLNNPVNAFDPGGTAFSK